MSKIKRPHLVVLPTMAALRNPAGRAMLTGKFDTGMRRYAQCWPGTVSAWMQVSTEAGSNLDPVEVDPDASSYRLELLDRGFGDEALRERLQEADVVLGGLFWLQNHISRWCREAGVPCVYVTEYAFRTRLQQVRAATPNLLRRYRKYVWHWQQERRHVAALRLADGVQANGTPTYNDYHKLVPKPLLYFDSRVSEDSLASETAVLARCAQMLKGGPLRLLFSGRFIEIKGVDHLPIVADHLRRMGVSFTLTLCGGGALEPALRQQVRRLGLDQYVRFAGNLDFNRALLPLVRDQADLFVCCHRQGDPSCTYLETMSCGVPIVGYDNEAWRGVVEHSGVGWLTPMDQPRRLAECIARIDRQRQALRDAALATLRFAGQHTFDRTFQRRVDHLLAVVAEHQRRGQTTSGPMDAAVAAARR